MTQGCWQLVDLSSNCVMVVCNVVLMVNTETGVKRYPRDTFTYEAVTLANNNKVYMVTEALSTEWTKLKRLSNICDTNTVRSCIEKTGRTWLNSGRVQLGEFLNCRRNGGQ
jgi:hypothetical protein